MASFSEQGEFVDYTEAELQGIFREIDRLEIEEEDEEEKEDVESE